MWIGSIEASDDHLIDIPLGVVKARAVTAQPGEQRREATAIEELQGTLRRTSNKHQGTRVRIHIPDEEQDNDEEEEPDEIQMDTFLAEEEPGGTADEVAKTQDVKFTRIGRSYNFTMKARDVLKYGPRPVCPGCKYVTGEVATQSGHSKECKIQDYDRDGERRDQASRSPVVCSNGHRRR